MVSLALGLVDGRFKLLTGVPHGILDLKGPGVDFHCWLDLCSENQDI